MIVVPENYATLSTIIMIWFKIINTEPQPTLLSIKQLKYQDQIQLYRLGYWEGKPYFSYKLNLFYFSEKPRFIFVKVYFVAIYQKAKL